MWLLVRKMAGSGMVKVESLGSMAANSPQGISGMVCTSPIHFYDHHTNYFTAKDDWLPTWGEGNDRGMTVKSVKMWQHGKC
jgi:hypothetical protein